MKACGVRISAYADGELSAAEAREVQTHLSTCAACAAEFEAIRAGGGVLREAGVPDLSAAAAMRIREGVERGIELARWRRLERFAGALTAVAACLAVVGAVLVWQVPSPAAPRSAVVITDEAVIEESPARELSTSEWMVAELSGTRIGGTYER